MTLAPECLLLGVSELKLNCNFSINLNSQLLLRDCIDPIRSFHRTIARPSGFTGEAVSRLYSARTGHPLLPTIAAQVDEAFQRRVKTLNRHQL
jgi:hypothetical protein